MDAYNFYSAELRRHFIIIHVISASNVALRRNNVNKQRNRTLFQLVCYRNTYSCLCDHVRKRPKISVNEETWVANKGLPLRRAISPHAKELPTMNISPKSRYACPSS